MGELFVRLWREEEGESLTEYALLLVLVSLMAVSSVKSLATTVNNVAAHAIAGVTNLQAPVRTTDNHLSDARLKASPSHVRWESYFKTHHLANNNR
jgi:Flp pilus assembly pilin Flp